MRSRMQIMPHKANPRAEPMQHTWDTVLHPTAATNVACAVPSMKSSTAVTHPGTKHDLHCLTS